MKSAQWVQAAVLAVTSLGILVALYSNNRQMNLLEKQMKASFFADYTRRFHDIMQEFPPDIASETFSYESLPEAERQEVLKNMKLYFDLCSEEYDLWENDMLEERVWRKWEAGISYSFSKKAYREAWEVCKQNSYYYEDFYNWVENDLLEQAE